MGEGISGNHLSVMRFAAAALPSGSDTQRLPRYIMKYQRRAVKNLLARSCLAGEAISHNAVTIKQHNTLLSVMPVAASTSQRSSRWHKVIAAFCFPQFKGPE
ncbi:hypothetical protein AAFF_G00203980 [Aldrovandia affinis]|uniref:Uncharacterized protein n=1 Tax=Aldrovandia affinis TaxID=143900 RepID=A0AAD7SX55_9TELE|nr:hypothetical protein AAFF_G00203980 [Aldrovandia affinis]